MELLSGAEMVVRALRDQGVKYIYGYPGGALLHLYDAIFQQDEVEHILVRHEQAATHMADAYARATGKAGVALVTSGPGATNAVTGIATAYMDSIPMVVITGQVMSHLIGEDAFQETDMIGISRPIVKHSFSIQRPEEIPEVIRKAFHIAESGRPGPVVVDIPKDMTTPTDRFQYEFPADVKLRSYNPVTKGHSGQIKKAFDMLMSAKRPVIYTGGGVIMGDASAELIELAQALNFPVTNTLMGLGGYPGTDRQFIGMLGMHGSYEANMAMHHSDLILAVGARFDDRVTNATEKFCPTAKIIHIDVDPASISKTIRADVPIVGAAKLVLEDMIQLLKGTKKSVDQAALASWWKQIDEWRERHGGRFLTDSELMKPQQVIEMLSKVTNGDAYVCSDVGQHQMFAAQYYKFNKPNRWINSGGLGTMGFGLPAAMGVKLNFPDADVACVTGEGSIQMNIQELSTCKQYDMPVKIICLNNQSLGMVRQWQDMNYESRHSQSYMKSLPDFVKLVESYGHVGIKVDKYSDLEAAMTEAFSLKDRLVFMDIAVDPHEHVYPMQVPRGTMRDMWLSKTERT
ncbi:acetolactate synthase 3 large subunit [Neptunomonas phycophila]|uniref:Acetolactate synthase n=1 Tax=Neptunomonas phycophila TaxID=1572645 RepID=A0AAW7XI32_9GAMM|nr:MULTISPECIES: acetolactate synthase 3 large subunit [Neptunomonas]MDN2659028.1 acetolactate synthase 3 large subunit [Neptunomonas sp. CHC150]MDO6452944.1 acetolactate synthase 3 large subunit [Neptunomonas phycophila]MDO6469654.1 acetolactate synthase 3 large subunit [Neptunomonas phycophila]MDP2524001.1 acetolactate synthase 3 large subunit [Neptunomonas phycophila]QLE96253.1 acetolactate synthase 3 large subunit [Neptunomonas phycophila]